jgi:GntR family transcriptional regulator/MocR family aminotransferase
MPIEWSGLSPALLLPLDRTRAEPLRCQLETGLREAIRSGRLQLGERLPSSRELAAELGVSRGLVQECYGQLQAEGYLETRVGSATRVASVGRVAPATPAPAPPAPLAVNFRSGTPSLADFPRSDWQWAASEATRTIPTAALDYGDGRGSPVLREVLAGYLRRVRGAAADPANLVICTGFAQGLNLVLRVLARTGISRVAFEDPGYDDGGSVAAASAGIATVPVPVDPEGIDVAALAASSARAVVLTPAHQWPTGVVLSPARRHAVIEWASRCDGIVIEDDYDAEFRYDREPIGALQGLAPDRVISISTVSKSLAPAVRLGWILAPTALAGELAIEKRNLDRGSPGLDQLTLATLLESGRFDRHLRRMRTLYSHRRTALVEALATHAPSIPVTGLAAGFHAIAHLPVGLSEPAVIAAASTHSVALYGMSPHRSTHSPTPPQLILGFGNLPERTIHQGITLIAPLLT